MTNDQIEQLARDAGFAKRGAPASYWNCLPSELQAFAALVRNAALEEAADKCEQLDFSYSACEQFVSGAAAEECAKEIRSMK